MRWYFSQYSVVRELEPKSFRTYRLMLHAAMMLSCLIGGESHRAQIGALINEKFNSNPPKGADLNNFFYQVVGVCKTISTQTTCQPDNHPTSYVNKNVRRKFVPRVLWFILYHTLCTVLAWIALICSSLSVCCEIFTETVCLTLSTCVPTGVCSDPSSRSGSRCMQCAYNLISTLLWCKSVFLKGRS
jgi:hypothetical protein